MRIVSLLCCVLLVLPLGSAALAGSSGDPDVVDDCGEDHVGTAPLIGQPSSHVVPWLDLEAGWLQLTEDRSALLVALRTCDAAPFPNQQSDAEGTLRVDWLAGDCRQSVTFHDHDPDSPLTAGATAAFASASCDAVVDAEVTASRVGDVVTWTIPLDGSLGDDLTATLLPEEDERIVLVQLKAHSGYRVNGEDIEGDETPFGRAVILRG